RANGFRSTHQSQPEGYGRLDLQPGTASRGRVGTQVMGVGPVDYSETGEQYMQEVGKLNVNGKRLWQSLMDLASVGATPAGGNCRLALTTLDGEARDLVVKWMKEAGLEVRVDQIGNIFGRRSGRNPSLGSIATGSHIDTQPTGGRFDGCYGVM